MRTQSLALVNLCSVLTYVDNAPVAATSIILGLFSSSPVVQAVYGVTAMTYVPQATMGWLAYGQLTLFRHTPWPQGLWPRGPTPPGRAVCVSRCAWVPEEVVLRPSATDAFAQ